MSPAHSITVGLLHSEGNLFMMELCLVVLKEPFNNNIRKEWAG